MHGPDRQQAGKQRIARLRASMAASGIELCAVYGSGRHELTRSNWCWFHSGAPQLGADACLFVPLEGECLLVVTPGWDARRVRAESWIDDIVATDSFLDTVNREVSARDWSSRRSAWVDLGRAPGSVAAGLRKILRDATEDGGNSVALPRVQDALAIAAIKRAVAIAEAGYERLRAVAAPGKLDHEVAAECDAALRAAGSNSNFIVVCASQHHLGPSPPIGRELAQGDVILAELSPSVDGQFAQICRTLVIGEPTSALRRNHIILEQAFAEALEACRPGSPVSEVTRAANRVIAANGFGAYNAPKYTRARGHAVGLGPMVPDVVSEQSTTLLEEGMAFVLHPNQYFPDSGYLFLGEHVLVEEHGARRLPCRAASLGSPLGHA